MATTNPSRGCGEDATPSQDCQGCGRQTDTVDRNGHCLDCEHASIAADMYAVEVTQDLIESTVRTALGQSYIHPEDVLAAVGRAISTEHSGLCTFDELGNANLRNMKARMRARGVGS